MHDYLRNVRDAAVLTPQPRPAGRPARRQRRMSLGSRGEALAGLAQGLLDVLIVGGGITGCGVALECAARGLATGLVEARDFGGGTSSRSTKLIPRRAALPAAFRIRLGPGGGPRAAPSGPTGAGPGERISVRASVLRRAVGRGPAAGGAFHLRPDGWLRRARPQRGGLPGIPADPVCTAAGGRRPRRLPVLGRIDRRCPPHDPGCQDCRLNRSPVGQLLSSPVYRARGRLLSSSGAGCLRRR